MTEFVKNQIVPLTITALSSDGNGIGHIDGMAVFVAGAVVGDELDVRLAKLCKSYAFGISEQIRTPSPERIAADCAVCRSCGGCDFRTMTYAAELAAKQGFVRDALVRLGGLSAAVEPVFPSPQIDGYRNKVQYPLTRLPDGRTAVGFYASRSHRVIPCPDCRLQPSALNNIVHTLCRLIDRFQLSLYEESSHHGLIRHLYLRHAVHTGEIMVCLVCNDNRLPHSKELLAQLLTAHPEITTVVLNVNTRQTNVITGEENLVLYGNGVIHDTLCGVPVTLDPLSFYQVNTLGAEQLYRVAAQFAAAPLPNGRHPATGTLLDLYCGAGTIGLSMVGAFQRLVGVEIVPQAVENARANALSMGLTEERARFLCADAGTAAVKLAAEGLLPDVVVLDPPRKGCSGDTLDAVLRMQPARLVMVSCNPATAARDLRVLCDNGYLLEKVQPVDMFPRTRHVETVALMTRTDVAKG